MEFTSSPQEIPQARKAPASPEHLSAEAKQLFNEIKAVEWNLANRESSTHTMYGDLLAESKVKMKDLGLTEEDYEAWKKDPSRGFLH
jgi:hypothetical protein